MPRQAFVDEGVIGIEEIEDAAVFRGSSRRRIRFRVIIAARRDSSKSGNRPWSGVNYFSLRVCNHWLAKFSAKARALGSLSMRLT